MTLLRHLADGTLARIVDCSWVSSGWLNASLQSVHGFGGSPPRVCPDPQDAFLRAVHASGQKWIILVGPEGEPEWVLEADGFLRSALLDGASPEPRRFCHRPILIRDAEATVESALEALHADTRTSPGDLINRDVVLLWGTDRRIVTGADLFGRLLRGVTHREPIPTAGACDPDRPTTDATPVAPKS